MQKQNAPRFFLICADDGGIYSSCLDGSLYAFTPAGELKWKPEGLHTGQSSPSIGTDGTIYVGSFFNYPDDDYLWAINRNETVYVKSQALHCMGVVDMDNDVDGMDLAILFGEYTRSDCP